MGRVVKNALLVFLGMLPGVFAAAADAPHPVTLWQVEGASNSVYLLGSIHLLRPQDYPLPTALDAAYEDAEVLIMEIDMDDMDPFAAQVAFTTYGVLKDEQTLQDLMGDDLYAQALAAAEIIDIPLDLLRKTEPWYAAMTVEIMMLSRIGFDPTLGIEMHMMSKAQEDGKPIEGFETVEEQVRFLDGMSLPAQREMLLSTLTESAKLGEMMDEMIDAWRHGDIAVLESDMLDEIASHEELNKALVTDRNARWVSRIDSLLDDSDDYLIIVGALHLIGKDGVPTQLRQLGYDVRQLSEPPTVR
jgi:uncharacterized protein YbaP (TraB family)